jgi:hypothetical protein
MIKMYELVNGLTHKEVAILLKKENKRYWSIEYVSNKIKKVR